MNAFAIIFKAIGDDTRLRIMHLFVRTNQALCVCELADALNVPQYQVSRQIKHLRESELLKVQKQGTWSYYYLNKEHDFRKQLFDFLEKTLISESLQRDFNAMTARLSYRKKGRCVVGAVSQTELRDRISS